ncbi:zinc dependent phospholipase C family protein [Paenibacillus caui]|uniref:zinc dependent phospholipase C family protein n=1 Tax=Paenibacillus caui TaxID=2873927 RepID=UPI001CA9FF62|nr:zinc dependent phospholipase C family protein [Paenibacillus caui]
MATWVTHFRIAEKLIDLGINVSHEDFLVGNIGPDCGLYGLDGRLNPPKEITHFKINGKINAELFYSQYIENNRKSINDKRLSFCLGYYFHLVTDQEWSKLYKQKKEERVYQDILGSPDYWNLIKRDWYNLDFLYLKSNRYCIFWTAFQYINQFPDYLNFFPEGQINEQIRRITRFYLEETITDDYEFVYLTQREVDEFVNGTVTQIKEILDTRIGVKIT